MWLARMAQQHHHHAWHEQRVRPGSALCRWQPGKRLRPVAGQYQGANLVCGVDKAVLNLLRYLETEWTRAAQSCPSACGERFDQRLKNDQAFGDDRCLGW